MDSSALDIAIKALEKEISGLELSIDGVEKWLWISSAAVAIGVIFEIVFLVHGYLEDRTSWRRGILVPPSRPSLLWLSFEIASVVLVVAGIVGELWVGFVSSNRNTDLRSKNNRFVGLVREKAGLAEKQAGDANKEAATARRDASNANALAKKYQSLIAASDASAKEADARAAEAQSMAKSAELARVELEARIAPRTLDLTQRVSMANGLRVFSGNFGGRKVRLEWQSVDIEATIFGVEIRDALSRAGIQSDGPTAGLTLGGPITIGLVITGPARDGPFIKTLYDLLHADLPRESMSAEWNPKFDTAPVTLMVGFKTPQALDTLPQSTPPQR